MMLKLFCAANLLLLCLAPSFARSEVGRENPGAVIDEFEAVVTLTEDDTSKADEVNNEALTFDAGEYMSDLRNAAAGKIAMDPEKVYTAQAMLPLGEVLVLATASGCSILGDPEGEFTGREEPLEFSFRVADLEDCGKVTESIVSSLQAEVAAEWSSLTGNSADAGVVSTTSMQDIGMRKGNKSSENRGNFGIGVQDLANAYLAANLEIKLIPTTSEGIVVMHFDITNTTTAQEITEMMSSVDPEKLRQLEAALEKAKDTFNNASTEDLNRMEEELKTLIAKENEKLQKDLEDGKEMLEQLSSDSVAEIECSALALDDCNAVSKCGVVKLNGKESCAVAPKTVYLLMETGCSLQSKAGLMSIARDLVSSGIMSEANHQTLRQSFDLARICNAIVHTYMSADIVETESHETREAFDL
ncbi:signal peptide containing protein, putative [Babesia ovata]|uniref:Signal peptide containing protein, putative n=1 Tax=Babesia ovata TaxID=189622 RepID=A0A2H6KAR1_9APIC|nr:signal peptide containing protein, putative [Babesia ovata]GBE60082.1 signal peptide containing protein, putative [Babesia ovata]